MQLARIGCVVFLYDMLGYADSAPLTQELAHGFKTQRPELSGPDRWGLFSAQSESRLISALGLQTWNSIRALDWLESLPGVDKTRIGVTGASGGGTQTFLLAAIDERPAAVFPAVMVSTAMQGGCTCENASYLRIRTGNIELAGLIAPRPLGMTAANDWTKELETKGLPELRALYTLLGVPDRVEGRHFNFPHNYNAVSRRMMYAFFNKNLNLGIEGPIEERDYVPLSIEEASVWDDEHPQPATDECAEVAVLRAIDRASRERMLRLRPHDVRSMVAFHRIVGGAFDVMIGRAAAEVGKIAFEPVRQPVEAPKPGRVASEPDWTLTTGLVRNVTHGEVLPTVLLSPPRPSGKVAVWIHRDGKAGAFDEAGSPIPPVRKLLRAGYVVVAADLFEQGEFRTDGGPLELTRTVANPRQFAGYTLGYNDPLFSQRTQDVMTLLAFARARAGAKADEVALFGFDEAAAWAAAAARSGDAERLSIGTGGFRFGAITDVRDPNLLPGAVKYGDLPGLLTLCATAGTTLWVADESEKTLGAVRETCSVRGNRDALRLAGPETTDRAAAAVESRGGPEDKR